MEHDRAAIRQKRSPRPPISLLPTELLISTLHLTLPKIDLEPPYGADTSCLYMQMLYNIRQVAKQWQEVIDGTPSFWTIIVSALPLHVNNATILRSGNLPLIIVYKYAARLNKEGLPSPEKFLQTIVHTRSRWSAVSLDVGEDKGISGYLADPAPLLQTMAIRSLRNSVDTEPWELLGGHPNNIRNVMISEASIHWKMGLFTELKTLSLKTFCSNLTAGHIVNYLGASPFLEELSIEGDLQIGTHQSSYPTISLSHLRYIYIGCCDDNETDYILQHIRAPSCINFRLDLRKYDVEIDYPRFLNETLNPFHGILRKIHIQNGASQMSVSTSDFVWGSGDGTKGSHGFVIDIGSFYPLGIRWVEQILQEEPGLQVLFANDAALSDAVLRDIAPLRCATGLMVTADDDSRIENIFSFLCQPLSPSASLPSLPCLRNLVLFSTAWCARDLLDMVQSRLTAFPNCARHPPSFTISLCYLVKPNGSQQPILDLDTLMKIREVEGIEYVQLLGDCYLEGTLAITWNEASQPN